MTEKRTLHVVDQADTLDEALSRAVQIVDRERFTHPHVEISPVYSYGLPGESDRWYFEISVGSELEDTTRD